MTLKEISEKFIEQIGDELNFENAKQIANQINALEYLDSKERISQTDKEIIYENIQSGIISKNISVIVTLSDSQNSRSRNATAYLLELIKSDKGGKKNDKL